MVVINSTILKKGSAALRDLCGGCDSALASAVSLRFACNLGHSTDLWLFAFKAPSYEYLMWHQKQDNPSDFDVGELD